MSDSADRPRKMGLENSLATRRLLVASVGSFGTCGGATGEEESAMTDL